MHPGRGAIVEQLKRVSSGIEGFDLVLKGGLIAGSSYIIQGRPGSGKTILANQIAFNHARGGGRVLFATLLSETHERLFQFLSTLSFFDRELIGAEMQFVSAFDTLENEGLDEVVKLLRREISRQKASVLVLDGVLNARSRADSQIDTKKFIAELQGHAAFAGCTVLFLTSARLDDGSPEHTMVDGVIELSEELIGSRSIRRLHLRKTRGSPALSGIHDFEIRQDGITVYPRLEALLNYPTRIELPDTSRVATGVPAFDEILYGGLPGSSVSLLIGPSGSGKTTLGLNFLSKATPEEPAIHFGFFETPERLLRKAKSIGLDLASLVESGALTILWQPTTERMLDALGHRLLANVRERGAKRVFIDSLGGMARASTNPARLVEFFSALTNELRGMGVTVMASWEMRDMFGSDIQAPSPDLSSIIDNLVLMRFVELRSELKRVVSVIKVRDSRYDPSLRELVITDNGVQLIEAFENVATVLSGTATAVGRS